MKEFAVEVEALIRKHALLNAYRHDGKADVGAVIGKVIGEKLELKSSVRMVADLSTRIVHEVNMLPIDEQMSLLESLYPEALSEMGEKKVEEKRLPPLPDAEDGKVVTRFPPEPNGYPHIGHAKAAVIDETYARFYHGRFILRLDDTNPAKEKLEYYTAIEDGLHWLGVKPDIIKNTSDDIDILYRYAERMIQSSSAYICLCRPDVVKKNRALQVECECRARSPSENLDLWNKMFTSFKSNEAILRFKGRMNHLNTVMRDPTLFRIVDAPHPLKSRAYRVWPTYDFSAPIEDSIDGVTHAMRTKEYELRDELYYAILEELGLRAPRLIEFSRLELRGTPISKRRLKPLIEEGLVQGWNDPRLPTLIGLKRRGFLPEAIREFVLSMGVSKVESEPTWDLLESVNRKMVDPIAKRYYFVPNPIRLVVEDAPISSIVIRFHPDRDLGERRMETGKVFYVPNEDVTKLRPKQIFRLMELFNVKLEEVGDETCSAHFAGSELIDGTPKLQWVTEKHLKFTLLVPEALFIDDQYNERSLTRLEGFVEEAASQLKIDDLVQFVRVGFCRIDGQNLAILTHR